MMRESGEGKFHIVLADDHALFRKGLRKILEETADLEVIGEASDGLELLSLLRKLTPDMIILDISMPNLRGIEAIQEIKRTHPDTKVLMLTMHKDKEYLYQTISAGADGYFLNGLRAGNPLLLHSFDYTKMINFGNCFYMFAGGMILL